MPITSTSKYSVMPGERVVHVDEHLVVFHARDPELNLVALFVLDAEGHALLNLGVVRKRVARHGLRARALALAVGVFGWRRRR